MPTHIVSEQRQEATHTKSERFSVSAGRRTVCEVIGCEARRHLDGGDVEIFEEAEL